MQTIDLELTETILDDLRNFFGDAITIDNVPAKDIDNRHVKLSNDLYIYPEPDIDIEHCNDGTIIYFYKLYSVGVAIVFSFDETILFLSKKRFSFKDFFAYFKATKDPIILEDAMKYYTIRDTCFKIL